MLQNRQVRYPRFRTLPIPIICHTLNRIICRVDALTSENKRLHEEVNYLSKILSVGPKNQVQTFHKAIAQIEKNLMSERKSHYKLLDKLQNEKTYLASQLEKLRISERSLKNKLQQSHSRNSSGYVEQQEIRTINNFYILCSCNTQNYISRHLASNVCEPNIDTIFQRKKSASVKKNKRAQIRSSSRSVSPQIRSEDVWKRLSEDVR